MTQAEAEAPAGLFVALLFLGPLPVAAILASVWLPLLLSNDASGYFVDAPVLTYLIALSVALAGPAAMMLLAFRARVKFGPDVLVSTVFGAGALLAAVAILAISVPLLQTVSP